MWKKLLLALLALALAAGLGAGLGALFMVLGGAVLASAGWSVIGMGGLVNIGLVSGAILLPIPLLISGFYISQGQSNQVSSSSANSSIPGGAVYGLVGAAVLGMTAGIQLGYVSAAGAIGAVVGSFGLAVAAGFICLAGYLLYQAAFEFMSRRTNDGIILMTENAHLNNNSNHNEYTGNTNNNNQGSYNTNTPQYNSFSNTVESKITEIGDNIRNAQNEMNGKSKQKTPNSIW